MCGREAAAPGALSRLVAAAVPRELYKPLRCEQPIGPIGRLGVPSGARLSRPIFRLPPRSCRLRSVGRSVGRLIDWHRDRPTDRRPAASLWGAAGGVLRCDVASSSATSRSGMPGYTNQSGHWDIPINQSISQLECRFGRSQVLCGGYSTALP